MIDLFTIHLEQGDACPNCKARHHHPDAYQCWNCDARLPANPPSIPKDGSSGVYRSAWMACSRCHKVTGIRETNTEMCMKCWGVFNIGEPTDITITPFTSIMGMRITGTITIDAWGPPLLMNDPCFTEWCLHQAQRLADDGHLIVKLY